MKIRISRIWCQIYKKSFLLSYYQRVSRMRNDLANLSIVEYLIVILSKLNQIHRYLFANNVTYALL